MTSGLDSGVDRHYELADFPAGGTVDEYAKFFEATYPSAKDRRAYLERLVELGKPSYGHLALALLNA